MRVHGAPEVLDLAEPLHRSLDDFDLGYVTRQRHEATLALVGRIGNGAGARVVTAAKILAHGGKQIVRLSRPRRFSRITAVVVNARFDVGTFLSR